MPTTQCLRGTCEVVLAETIAGGLMSKVRETITKIHKGGAIATKPRLAAFLANNDPFAVKYAEWSKKTCEENGLLFDIRRVNQNRIEEEIIAANEDETVDGIIVYYPIFPQPEHDKLIQEMVSPAKDVEGLNSNHLHSIYRKDHSLDSLTILEQSVIPCTPLAIVKILEHLRIYTPVLSPGSRLLGKTITVINRSEVNGRPLAALLANDGASVYSVDLTGVQLFKAMGTCRAHHEVYEKPGWTLEDVLPLSGIVISGVPSKDFQVPSDLLREGAVCINFSSFYNFNRASIKERASVYVPSVGKVTVVMLLKNLTRLIANRRHLDIEAEAGW